MATNILNTSAFEYASMRMVPDEVITADWAQKLAENTGYLRANPRTAPSIDVHSCTDSTWTYTIADKSGTVWFVKPPFCGTLVGTVNFTRYASVGITQHAKIWLDGTHITPASQGTLTASGDTTTTFGFSKSISHLSDSTAYSFSLALADTSSSAITNTGVYCNTYFTP